MTAPTEMHDGRCEVCGSSNNPENLYTDLFNNQWSLVCPTCFYKKNNGNVSAYFDRVKQVTDDVMTEKQFNKTAKRVIPIGNTFPYFKEGAKFIPVPEKTELVDNTIKHFFGLQKIRNKFTVLQAKAKCSEQVEPNGVIFLVAIVGKVKFNSYLEYLEHRMFEEFRKECKTLLR